MAPSKSLAPTLTLAQLYESQNQLFDALAVYRKLHAERGDEEILEKLESVQEKILSDEKLHYNSRITEIFSADERKRLKIIPQDRFERLQESMRQQNEDDEELAVESDEELAPQARKAFLEGSYEEEESPEPVAAPSIPEITGGVMSMRIADFADRTVKILGGNRKLQEITLGDLLKIFHGNEE